MPFLFKIKLTKNNSFITVSHWNGKLIAYTSLKNKKTKDLKVKLSWGLLSLLKKLKDLKIQFIILYIQNMDTKIIQHIFTFLKTWDIKIIYLKYELLLPHNGCRHSHKTRKRNKGRKKNKEIFMGL